MRQHSCTIVDACITDRRGEGSPLSAGPAAPQSASIAAPGEAVACMPRSALAFGSSDLAARVGLGDLARRWRKILRRGEAPPDRLRLLESACAAANIGFWECSLPDERISWSPATYEIFGLPSDHRVERRDALEFYTKRSLEALQSARAQAIATCTGFTLDTELVSAQGATRWMRITATVDHRDGSPTRIFGLKQDITEEKLSLETARYRAEYDTMTGLANRVRFEAKLADLCGSWAPETPPGALLIVDLDGFKQMNDTHGHAAGDECLVEAARRLSRLCEDTGFVARIGGDEFAILMPPGSGCAAAEALAARIVVAMAEPMRPDQPTGFGASVGVALAGRCTPHELFGQADLALYAAKGAGRRTFRTYDAFSLAG